MFILCWIWFSRILDKLFLLISSSIKSLRFSTASFGVLCFANGNSMRLPKLVGSCSENELLVIIEFCWWAILSAILMSSAEILSLPGDSWFEILVSTFAFSSVVIIWVSGFGASVCFSISVTSSLWNNFWSDFELSYVLLCGLVITSPLSLYMIGFSKGFWCSSLTTLNILWSSFIFSSSCRIASICFSLIFLTLVFMFFRILLFFRFSSIIFLMSVVFLILTRIYFCSIDIWCNWWSDFSLLQLGSLKPKLSLADSVITPWSRADSFSVRVCWYNSFVNGSLSFSVVLNVTTILWLMFASVPECDRASPCFVFDIYPW